MEEKEIKSYLIMTSIAILCIFVASVLVKQSFFASSFLAYAFIGVGGLCGWMSSVLVGALEDKVGNFMWLAYTLHIGCLIAVFYFLGLHRY